MKAKYALVLLGMGICTDFIGAWFKSCHYKYATEILFTGMMLKIAGVVWLVYKLITSKQLRDFMNH